jgi:hypothetical protein
MALVFTYILGTCTVNNETDFKTLIESIYAYKQVFETIQQMARVFPMARPQGKFE